MLYISWFSLQLPLCWLSLLPRTIINKSYFTFNCPLKFLLLCPVLIFGLNHIQLFRESESSLKFFLSRFKVYHFVDIKVCLFWWWSSLLGTWSRSSHVFSADAGSLLSRNPESFSATRRAQSRRPGRAGLGQPSSVQPPVKTSTQTQSPALAALNPPSLCRVKDGTKMWKFPDKSTHGGLPPSHVTLGKPRETLCEARFSLWRI